jgi:glycerol-3-phosphate acyltransferase PlsY
MTALVVKTILAYLLGSVSGSLLLGKLKNVDIRSQGSGNAGGTNAFRTQGPLFAIGVLVIDMGKGVLAAGWIPTLNISESALMMGANELMMVCGFAAVLGHCFPIWHGFRGGKGAATAVGALIAIEPWLLIPVLITWLLTLVLTGYVGLSTILAGISLVPGSLWLADKSLFIFATVMAVFLLFTHRGNLQKLRKGTEHRFERISFFSRKH